MVFEQSNNWSWSTLRKYGNVESWSVECYIIKFHILKISNISLNGFILNITFFINLYIF